MVRSIPLHHHSGLSAFSSPSASPPAQPHPTGTSLFLLIYIHHITRENEYGSIVMNQHCVDIYICVYVCIQGEEERVYRIMWPPLPTSSNSSSSTSPHAASSTARSFSLSLTHTHTLSHTIHDVWTCADAWVSGEGYVGGAAGHRTRTIRPWSPTPTPTHANTHEHINEQTLSVFFLPSSLFLSLLV